MLLRGMARMGRMPVSLIRDQMLGAHDQVAGFWDFEPIPPAP